MSGATFGRKATADGTALAARRAAFLAEERARAARHAEDRGCERGPLPPGAAPGYIREKSMGTAYLLWFFLGGFSAHRFYLGFTTSAMIQLVLAPIGYGLLLSEPLVGFVTLIFAGLWILADVFLIPGMHREANAQSRRHATPSVFA